MRNCAAPHDVGTRFVIVGIGDDLGSLFHDSQQDTFGHTVADLHIGGVAEITFEDMCHHVGDAAGSLPFGQRHGQFGIHDGEFRTQQHGLTNAQLLERLFVGNDRIARTLATGSRDGEHDTDGQAVAHLGLADKEVPEVAFVIVSCGNGLGRIDDRTATHSEHKVGFETAGKSQSFVNLGVGGIGTDATHFDIGDGNGIERGLDTIEQATANHRAASIDDHHTMGTVLDAELANFLFASASETKLSRGVESEIIHVLRILIVGAKIAIVAECAKKNV